MKKVDASKIFNLFSCGKMYVNNTPNISWPLFVESETGKRIKTTYLYSGETFVVLSCYSTEDHSYNVLKILTEQGESMMMMVHPQDIDLFLEL